MTLMQNLVFFNHLWPILLSGIPSVAEQKESKILFWRNLCCFLSASRGTFQKSQNPNTHLHALLVLLILKSIKSGDDFFAAACDYLSLLSPSGSSVMVSLKFLSECPDTKQFQIDRFSLFSHHLI